MRHMAALLAVVACLAAGSSVPAAANGEVRVAAAASLTNVLVKLGAMYTARTGVRVVYSFGASSTLARQIANGAPADVYFPADLAWMDSLGARGALAQGTRRSLLSNSLAVLTTPALAASVRRPADLLKPGVARIAIAEPSTVPAGIYAQKFLHRAGLWDRLRDRLIPTDNVRAAMLAVEQGNADAAIVYATDARVAKRARLAFLVPASQSPRIEYPVAVLRGAASPAAARAFVAYLASPEARVVFEGAGFGWMGSRGAP